MTDTKLLERILKLHAKAESAKAIGSEAEAMIFADAVQKMLIANNLELSDIEFKLQAEKDPVKMHIFSPGGKKRAVFWQLIIAMDCAKAHLCLARSVGGSDAIALIGRRENRRICEYVLATLFVTAEKLADKAYTDYFYKCRDEGNVEAARGFRKSFLIGFADRVAERYEALWQETQKTTPGTGLVRLNKEQLVVQDTAAQIDAELGARSKPLNAKVTEAGETAGRLAGDNVNLSANAMESGQAASRKVGAGQKLLGVGRERSSIA